MIELLASYSQVIRKSRTRLLLPLILVASVAGCSDPITRVTVVEPERHSIPSFNYLIFRQSEDKTWERLLEQFLQSDFRIDSVDSGAHFLNVSVSGRPEEYIDCGKKTIETLAGGDSEKKIQINNTTEHYQYRKWRRNHLDTYTVDNAFTGKANLFVTGDDKQSRIIVQYDLMLKAEVDYSTTQGQRFTKKTKKVLHIKAGEDLYFEAFGAKCRSTGRFEKALMDTLSANSTGVSDGNDSLLNIR